VIFFVIYTRDILVDNVPEEKVEKDTNIDSVAFEDLEGGLVTERLLGGVVHNATDTL